MTSGTTWRKFTVGPRAPRLQVGGAVQHHARHADGDDQRVDRDHLAAGDLPRHPARPARARATSSYLLWMLMGYLLVTAVLVVTLGRLGDMYGRVRDLQRRASSSSRSASIALALDPLHGGGGALWLIVWRVVQGVGGAMLFANSTAILTDAFPADQRGMALGINQVAAIAGSFIGLILGGLLAEWTGARCSSCRVPIGIVGTIWSYRQPARARRAARRRASTGGATSPSRVGLTALLAGITYGIQPYGGHTHGLDQPVGARRADRRRRAARSSSASSRPGSPSRCSPCRCSGSAPSRPATWPACSPRSPAAACSSC